MRNITGALAQAKFTEAVLSALRTRGVSAQSCKREEKITRISWSGRVLLFDRKPRMLGKSVDVILLRGAIGEESEQDALEDRLLYFACGDLKGGIDPAGADEHWKTARSALDRIRACFKGGDCPKLFFAGAAIVQSMAEEIFERLRNEELTFAANLTMDEQVSELSTWLVSL